MKNYLALTAIFMLMSCSPSKQLPDQPVDNGGGRDGAAGGNFDIEGHRGCRGLMPENTIPAMMKALEMGVTTLEMDIVFTKDKKAILSHEPFFNHEITTKPGGGYVTETEEKSLNIYQMTYAETQRYDVGMKPHPRFPKQQKIKVTKPLLSELIDSINQFMKTGGRRHYPYLNIETKTQPSTDNIYHPAPEAFVDLLMAVIREKKIEPYVIIQSFDTRTLQYLHRKYPAVKTALLVEDTDKVPFDEQIKKLGFKPSVYSPHYSLVTEDLIRKCHAPENDIRVVPWTVNDQAAIKKLKEMGVDGIITDYPDLFNY